MKIRIGLIFLLLVGPLAGKMSAQSDSNVLRGLHFFGKASVGPLLLPLGYAGGISFNVYTPKNFMCAIWYEILGFKAINLPEDYQGGFLSIGNPKDRMQTLGVLFGAWEPVSKKNRIMTISVAPAFIRYQENEFRYQGSGMLGMAQNYSVTVKEHDSGALLLDIALDRIHSKHVAAGLDCFLNLNQIAPLFGVKLSVSIGHFED